MLRWMTGIKRIEKIRTEEVRARAGVADTMENFREATVRWLEHVERTTEGNTAMRTWKLVDTERLEDKN